MAYTQEQLKYAKQMKMLGWADSEIASNLKFAFGELTDKDIKAILDICAKDPSLNIPHAPDIRDTTQYLYPYELKQNAENGKLDWCKKASFQNIPPHLLGGGSQTELQSYLDKNSQKLSDDEKLFLQARITSDKKYAEAKNKKLAVLYRGEDPKPLPSVQKTIKIKGKEQRFVGLNLKLDGPQNSWNGCWSTACSLMLKSRGVDLKQEDIRAFRPHPGEGASLEETVAERFNKDVGESVEDRADAMLEVLPNTAVDTLMLSPIEMSKLKYDGRPLENFSSDDQQSVSRYLLKNYCENVANIIRTAIETHGSPVAMTNNGHTVTITGIGEDNNTLLYEESLPDELGKPCKDTTYFWHLNDLLKDFVLDLSPKEEQTSKTKDNKDKKKDEKKRTASLQLSWLRDIKMPPFSESERSKPIKLCDESVTHVEAKVESDNTVAIQGVKESLIWDLGANGQFAGVEVQFERKLKHQSRKLKSATGAGISIGNLKSYLPKKLYYKGDPSLANALDLQKAEPETAPLTQQQFVKELNNSPQDKDALRRCNTTFNNREFKTHPHRHQTKLNNVTNNTQQNKPPYPPARPVMGTAVAPQNRKPEAAMVRQPEDIRSALQLDPALMKLDDRLFVAYDQSGNVFYALRQDVIRQGNGYVVKQGAPVWRQTSGKRHIAGTGQFTVPKSTQCFYAYPGRNDVLYAVDMRDVDRFYRPAPNAPLQVHLCKGRAMVTRFYYSEGRLLKDQVQAEIPANTVRAYANGSHPILRALRGGQTAGVSPQKPHVTGRAAQRQTSRVLSKV